MLSGNITHITAITPKQNTVILFSISRLRPGRIVTLMSDVIRAWSRIENWLQQHQCTAELDALRPPASEEAIRFLRDAVPYPLHPHLVQWLQVHDGARQECSIWPFRYSPIQAEGMEGGPQHFGEAFGDFRAEFTDDGLEPEGPEGPWDPPNAYEFWVPIAVTDTGEYLAVDHRPGATYGTVREIDCEGSDVWGVIRWKDLGGMFNEIADGLESGSGVRGSGRTHRSVPQLVAGPPAGSAPHLFGAPVAVDGAPVNRLDWRIED